MAAEYQRLPLSGSTNYLPININSIATTTAPIIHTCHSTNADEVWLFAYNYTYVDVMCNLMLGGSANHQILSTPIPAEVGEVPILLGKTFTGGVVISAFCDVINSISIIGYVNRIIFV